MLTLTSIRFPYRIWTTFNRLLQSQTSCLLLRKTFSPCPSIRRSKRHATLTNPKVSLLVARSLISWLWIIINLPSVSMISELPRHQALPSDKIVVKLLLLLALNSETKPPSQNSYQSGARLKTSISLGSPSSERGLVARIIIFLSIMFC